MRKLFENRKFKRYFFMTLTVIAGTAMAAGLILPVACFFFDMAARPDPPMPEITEAGFPFKLVYKVYGEEFVYEDTVICSLAGIANDEGHSEKYRVWDLEYQKKPYIVLSELENGNAVVFYPSVHAAYLMGDKESHEYKPAEPNTIIGKEAERYNGGLYYETVSRPTDEELLEEYGIEIVSFDIAPPIENTFIEKAEKDN